ncbi:hypothetical protein [Piscinibacter koreensis]|uniref:Uncharacterized protein n=1 Tax=Piscinibacter koreensis TaxID=2742824 RepID=A0A7Y6TVV3_9BURK|nr:hypothetical protein [Schlegelella koreensis]NUZ05420.1 hypothetical protein [Schlegelella koreensis]
MKHTVIAVFDHADDARRAAEALSARGIARADVHLGRAGAGAPGEPPVPPSAQVEGGPGQGLLHRLSALFGVAEPHLGHYTEAVERGACVVSVDAHDEAEALAARDALIAAGAVDIDDRVEEWQRSGAPATPSGADAQGSAGTARGAVPAASGAAAPTGGWRGVAVHRQEVSIGGVRVYGHTAVRTFDDLDAELRADHDARDPDGSRYEEHEPAYRHGHALADEPRHRGRSWDEIEPEARADWERRHPENAWERFKASVRHAWERATH